MNISLFVSILVNGLAMGVVYAMLGMGLILLIRAVGVLNFSQGDLLMFCAYICASLIIDFELPFYLMAPIALVLFALIGLFFMFFCYWPIRKSKYPIATVVATMGAAIILKEGAVLIWGTLPRTLPSLVLTENKASAVLKVGTITLQWQYIIIIVVGALIMFGIYLLFEKLYIGKMMQAASQDSYAANLLGIPTILTVSATYIIVVSLAGISGYLVAPIFLVRSTLGSIQLRAFAGVVIGGFGSIKGAVIGCLLVGIIEAFASLNFSEYRDVTIFLILLIFLLLRPQGIVGSKISDKA